MKEYHILSLSGGKDSTALAFYIKENMPEIFEKLEFVFCDTECELSETYDYLNKVEVFLGKPILKIKPYQSFEHLMDTQNYFPSPVRRWCTVELKTKPFKRFVKNILQDKENIIYLYIGIRADEPKRAKYNKYNNLQIKEVYPLFDNGFTKQDVLDLLENNGIGLPDYYKWSSRSGCYFCPYQSKMNWLNLYNYYPDLFLKVKTYEDIKNATGRNFKKVYWNIDMSLDDILKNKDKIIANYEKRNKKVCDSLKLIDLFIKEECCV